MSDESEIRALIEERVRAVRAKDVDGAMASHAPDVAMFDVIDPLRYGGSDAVRERVEAWFGMYDGPIGYEVRDLSVTAGGDVAFCHFLYHVSGTKTDGGKVSMWVRATMGFRRTGGAWVLVHDHESVPFDPETGRASLGLEP
ncbi:MAG TPA: SgcJ/EcaC family oxidoreductase [Longimicrobiaceae bacterium]